MVKERIEGLIKKEKSVDSKKKIESLVVFVIILVITIIAINSIWNNDKKSSNDTTNTSNKKLAINNEINLEQETYNSNNLEANLEAILSSINGVGRAQVFINYIRYYHICQQSKLFAVSMQ